MKEINQNIFQCSSDVLVPNQGVNTDELLNSNLDLDNINGQEAPDEVEKMILSDTTVNELLDQLINNKQFNRKHSAQISSIDPLSTSQNNNDPDATISTTKSTTETLSYYRTPAKDELFLDSDSESEPELFNPATDGNLHASTNSSPSIILEFQTGEIDNTSLDVSGLGTAVTKRVLENLFGRFGAIKNIDDTEISMTHTSQVVFYRKEDALLAKKHLNGYVLFGSKIIITFPLSSITGNGHSISEHRSTIKTSIPINNQHIQKKVIGDKHSSNRSSSATNQFKHAEQSTDMNISIASTGSANTTGKQIRRALQKPTTDFRSCNKRSKSHGRSMRRRRFSRRDPDTFQSRYISPIIRSRSYSRTEDYSMDRNHFNRNDNFWQSRSPRPPTPTHRNQNFLHYYSLVRTCSPHYLPPSSLISAQRSFSENKDLRSIQVFGLSPATTKEELCGYLEHFGHVMSCIVFPQHSLGVATFKCEKDANKAIERMDGIIGTNGQMIRVCIARRDILMSLPSSPMPTPIHQYYTYPASFFPFYNYYMGMMAPECSNHNNDKKRKRTHRDHDSTSETTTTSSNHRPSRKHKKRGSECHCSNTTVQI